MSSSGSEVGHALRRIVIATRESALAMWQAHYVRDALARLHPECEIRMLPMTTEGDRRLGTSLAKIGGKGLFVKELESALESGAADLAVHSMKDVPMHLPAGFTIAAITAREDPRDAFVSSRYRTLAELPQGARVGTSSLRRESLIRARFPALEVRPLRGNVQTRLRKLDAGDYDAIILAAAGLKRLGLEARIAAYLPPEESVPAVGQGALGIECRTERADIVSAVAPLNDEDTACCVRAERALSRALAGSCNVPLGGFARFERGRIELVGFVASPDGKRFVFGRVSGDADAAERIGGALAEDLCAQGARAILDELAAA